MLGVNRLAYRKSFVPRALIASTLLLGGIGSAQESTGTDFTKRLYVSGGVGVTLVEPVSPTDALTVSDDQDTGAHLGLGYDLSRMFSVEAYVADLGAAEIDFLGVSAGNIDYQVYGVSLLGYLVNSRSGLVFGDKDRDGLFRREGLSLYGRVGIGQMSNDATGVEYYRDYSAHVAFGMGLEYGFGNGFALRSEFMSMDTDAKYLNVGILKRFGDVSPVIAAAPPSTIAAPTLGVAVAEVSVDPQESVQFKPVVPPNVYFDIDSSKLNDQFLEKLDAFAELTKDRQMELLIAGHTDWIAPEKYNMSLSVRRAEAVSNYLSSKGLEPQLMTIVGYGETRPISSNDTPNGRALNRRVEIQIR